MAKAVRFLKQSQTEFSKRFEMLCRTKGSWEAWADFVTMSAITISNSLDREGETHDQREQEYLRIINRYSKPEQAIFPELFALMVKALDDDPEQDFLGDMFMSLNLGNHWKGQFFTPYNVCRMMAEMQIDGIESLVERQGWVSINDSCCGAGALLIAARNAMARRKIGYTGALYVAQDIDRTAALMCYIQLSLLGCAGYVVVADSLLYPAVGPGGSPLLISPTPEQEIWLMPALYDETWRMRIQLEHVRFALKSLGVMESAPDGEVPRASQPVPELEPQEPPPLNETHGGQLTLF